jgi:hypothetical protein
MCSNENELRHIGQSRSYMGRDSERDSETLKLRLAGGGGERDKAKHDHDHVRE